MLNVYFPYENVYIYEGKLYFWLACRDCKVAYHLRKNEVRIKVKLKRLKTFNLLTLFCY